MIEPIAGVQVVASWGEDDERGVTGYYTGTWGDFSVKVVASYSGTNDPNLVVANPACAFLYSIRYEQEFRNNK